MGFWATLSFLNGKQDRPHIHCSHTAFAEGRIREGRKNCGTLLKGGLEKEVGMVVFFLKKGLEKKEVVLVADAEKIRKGGRRDDLLCKEGLEKG